MRSYPKGLWLNGVILGILYVSVQVLIMQKSGKNLKGSGSSQSAIGRPGNGDNAIAASVYCLSGLWSASI
ncbi:hypothetical protein ASB62_06020 [Chlorobium limicola]|uniref:Uncharacterized protein n=1 Tax=Chlorobium limicola TaxID=1092 RepID=A0A101JIZ9_CHLLI|nr:hypothetical protein ASB62_06020 [Chlorobium limicola]